MKYDDDKGFESFYERFWRAVRAREKEFPDSFREVSTVSLAQRRKLAEIAWEEVLRSKAVLKLVSATLPYNLMRQVGMEHNEDRRRERAIEDSLRDAERTLMRISGLPPQPEDQAEHATEGRPK